MATEAEGDMTPVALLYANGFPTEDYVEADLANVLQAFHQQIEVAARVTMEWNALCHDGSWNDNPALQISQVGTYLRNAMITKERMIRLGTRYLLSDLLYDRTVLMGTLSPMRRQQWLENRIPYDVRGTQIMLMMDRHAIVLSKSIAEMETRMRAAEQRAMENGNQRGLTHRKESNDEAGDSLEELKEEWRRREIEMVQLIEKIDAKEQAQQPPDTPRRRIIVEEGDGAKVLQVQVNNDGEEGALSQASPEETDDCEYFLRMLQEVAGGTPSPPPPSENTLPSENIPTQETNYSNELDSAEERLRLKLERMLNDIKYYPNRRLGEWWYGIDPWIKCAFCNAVAQHFSDSCPHVSRGTDRLRIVLRKGLCTRCLQFCTNSYQCRSHSRPCWYCQRIKGNSFREMLPSDEGNHHRAICSIPDRKREAEESIDELQAQLFGMLQLRDQRTRNARMSTLLAGNVAKSDH